MRNALVLIVLVILAIPTTALADEAKLHGGWNLAAVALGAQRFDVPPELNFHIAFDRTKKIWTFKTDQGGQTTEVTGPYRLAGDQLFLTFQGQESPPMTIAFVQGELHFTIALPNDPNAEKTTLIAKRGAFVARPKPARAKPAPPPTPKQQPKSR
jgi:hypothetical protein